MAIQAAPIKAARPELPAARFPCRAGDKRHCAARDDFADGVALPARGIDIAGSKFGRRAGYWHPENIAATRASVLAQGSLAKH